MRAYRLSDETLKPRTTHQLETVARTFGIARGNIFDGDSESAETTTSEFFDVVFKHVLLGRSPVAGAEVDDGSLYAGQVRKTLEKKEGRPAHRHSLGDALHPLGRQFDIGDLGTLVDRVERLKIELSNPESSKSGIAEVLSTASVDGVLILGSRCVSGEEADLFGVIGGRVAFERCFVDGELVCRERTRFVGAEDGDAGELLNGGDTCAPGCHLPWQARLKDARVTIALYFASC